MRSLLTTVVAVVLATLAYGAEAPQSYADARASWEKHKDSPEYQAYVDEFVQFNNQLHLDTRGGCYALGAEQVGLMLVITHVGDAEFATVQNVLSDVDSPKAGCFVKSYLGLKTKVPPYMPLCTSDGHEVRSWRFWAATQFLR